MESKSLHLSVDAVGSSGFILSPEQKAALQTSLVLLQNNQKFKNVVFWGKIIGGREDYYIAQGVTKDYLSEKRTLYSKDCVHWGVLPPATPETKQKSKQITGYFTGDPSFEFEQKLIKKVGDGDEETEEVITLKEEDRLAAVISEIDHDVAIVPRGAFVRSPTGEIYQNRAFDGLTLSEASQLYNFLHFRKAEKLLGKTLLQRANLDKSIDFLDTIEEDIPKGCWSLQMERGGGLVTLRSLLWLGYVFYHVPGTRQYGSVYFGRGDKNIDLPFMLS